MRYARVKAGACSALGNRVFLIGDQVNEDNFHKGVFDEYLESGHLELISEDGKKVSAPERSDIELIPNEKAKVVEPKKKEEESQKDEEPDPTKTEIMAQLDELGIKYKKSMSVNELYDLWKNAGKK